MPVLTKTATMAVSVLAIGLTIGPAQSRPLGPGGATPQTAVQKVQTLQEIDREQARARVRQRVGERWREMTPAERLRAKHRARQAAQRLEERWEAMTPAERARARQRARQVGERIQEKRPGYGYIARERAKARARDRLEERAR